MTAPGADGADRVGRAECAVVLAAGAGLRLRSSLPEGAPRSKPLVPVLGTPILVRSLLALQDHGVRQAVIVTGHAREDVTRVLLDEPRLAAMGLAFAHNADWRLQNGVSVLAARATVGERAFYLLMGDHLYEPALLQSLRAAPPGAGELALAVDRKLEEVSDLDDAVKVRTCEGRIADLGKRLDPFDAVDTGVFLSTPALFESLAGCRERQQGDCSLVDGVRGLALCGRARAVDIGSAWWQDVDDYDGLRRAERRLRELDASAAATAPAGALTASGPRAAGA